jgi:hypothetical protein
MGSPIRVIPKGGRLAFSIYGISSVEQALQRHVTQKH